MMGGVIRRMIGLFGKSAGTASPQVRPPINEDWRVGDLAECIVRGGWFGDAVGPEHGEVCRVVRVFPGKKTSDNGPSWGLNLNGYRDGFDAFAFRKVTPRADSVERCDAEFLAIVRRVPADVEAACAEGAA